MNKYRINTIYSQKNSEKLIPDGSRSPIVSHIVFNINRAASRTETWRVSAKDCDAASRRKSMSSQDNENGPLVKKWYNNYNLKKLTLVSSTENYMYIYQIKWIINIQLSEGWNYGDSNFPIRTAPHTLQQRPKPVSGNYFMFLIWNTPKLKQTKKYCRMHNIESSKSEQYSICVPLELQTKRPTNTQTRIFLD